MPLELREDPQMSVAEESGRLIVAPDAVRAEPEQRRALSNNGCSLALCKNCIFASMFISKRWGSTQATSRSKTTEHGGAAVKPMAAFN